MELPLSKLKEMLPDLLEDLEDDYAYEGAVILLGKLPPAMLSEHFPALFRASLYRCSASYFLEREPWRLILEQKDAPALAELTDEIEQALRHTEGFVRCDALGALGKFPLTSVAAHAATVRDVLAAATSMANCDITIRELAVELLARLPGTPALACEPATLPAERKVRGGQPPSLGKLPAAAVAAPTLATARMLQDEDFCVRARAIAELQRLGPAAVQEYLRELLSMAVNDSSDHVRSSAMRAIDKCPAAALAERVPALLLELENPSYGVPQRAAEVLQKVDGALLAAHTTTLLSKVLVPAEAQQVREGAAEGLALLPPAAIVPHLGALLTLLGKAHWNEHGLGNEIPAVLRKGVESMPTDAVAKVLTVNCKGTDQAWMRKAVLDRVIGQLPAEVLRLHAPLLMTLTPIPTRACGRARSARCASSVSRSWPSSTRLCCC
jgi:HEAT repeat protein